MSAVATETIARQPDISYAPDHDKYRARTSARLSEDPLLKQKTLPAGFPLRLTSDFAWDGEGLAERYDWTYELTAADVQELESGLAHFKSLNKPLGYVDQDTFPLPKLHAVLRDVSKELHQGHGFKVIRGMPVQAHSREDNIIMYAGISSHIAPTRGRQDNQFHGKPADVVLAHVKDLSAGKDKAEIGAPAYTTDKQVFHTDVGDLVSLFALSTAAEGGTSRLASSWRVYNELAATRPDLIETLADSWPTEVYGDPKIRYVLRPPMFYQPATADAPQRVLLQYARRNFTGFGALSRSKDTPPMTEAQAEALDALHFLGEKFNVGLDFRQGDIQYVNNLAVFHARDAFTDTPEQQRHLVRLWLRDPEYAWETPEALKYRWAGVYDGVTPENQIFPLDPYVRSASNGSKNT